VFVLNKSNTLLQLKNGMIVSCQPRVSSALDHPNFVAALARVAEEQGAVAVRIRGARDIRAVRRSVHIPVLGIEKINYPDSEVYITPTLESVRRVHHAGGQIIAMDATERPRPRHQSLADIIKAAMSAFDSLLMADVATLQQGVEAARLGFDIVGTTLCGYTEDTKHCKEPAFDLARQLVREVDIPVILEGHLHEPDHVRKAFDLGVYAVVVGTAISDFEWLSRRFIEACPSARTGRGTVPSSGSISNKHTASKTRKRKLKS
jgi:N-acylglucosamine-6-phosphate 2-epimerase